MCNPPFYSSREEIEKSNSEKGSSPSAVCTGADTEMITPGGESAFVRQMVAESLVYRTKCRYVASLKGLRVWVLMGVRGTDGSRPCSENSLP